mmetsp:Transcript_16909/g.40155  ORF Transcript_16909/g.40155 Transcript_16909/m.40155 type:complete len:213 (+) Transcript_16909:475-1113(+)
MGSCTAPTRNTQSNPSSTRSTRRSVQLNSTCRPGCCARKLGSAGSTRSSARRTGRSTRRRPLSCRSCWNSASISLASPSKARARSASSSPSGVRLTRRVVRWKSRVPSWASSALTIWLTRPLGKPSSSAARLKWASSATCRKTRSEARSRLFSMEKTVNSTLATLSNFGRTINSLHPNPHGEPHDIRTHHPDHRRQPRPRRRHGSRAGPRRP